jgi:threonine dehydrogenase-like Zn-dependent dehydrogenase
MKHRTDRQMALSQKAWKNAGSSPIELIDTAAIPGGGELQLLRCGADFSIQFGDDELMGNQAVVSEEALASLAIRRLGKQRERVLIGGLGMGFTLGAALAELPTHAEIIVAELVPKVVDWAHGPLAHLFGESLADPRVRIEIRDVHDVIVSSPDGFDAILLDVDNGPDGFIDAANDRLYCNWGLRASLTALRPGGVLAIWSAYPDDAFHARLSNAGFLVDEVEVDDPTGRERAPYIIWLAFRPSEQSTGMVQAAA